MTYSAIAAKDSVGKVGQKTVLSVVGTPASASTPPVVFWYVQSAPSDSSVRTLDQLAVLQDYNAGKYATYSGPLPLGIDRKELRLTTNATGAEFTPDVPGKYSLVAYDITLYKFVPHYGGHVPAASELGEVDNELAALPAYAGGNAQAPTVTLDYWVEETRSRGLGVTPDTATITITGYNDQIDQLIEPEKRVVLKPAQTPIAKLAVTHQDVRAALNTIRGRAGAIYSVSDGLTMTIARISELRTKWNLHLGMATDFTTHQTQDTTNAAGGSATDLASTITLLNLLKTKVTAHFATTGTVHNIADSTSNITAPTATDFATCSDLWRDIYDQLSAHMILGGPSTPVHWSTTTGPVTPVDGTAKEWLETPFPGDVAHLCTQTNALASLYRAHRLRTTNTKPHAAADTDNVVDAALYSDPVDIANALNALAFSIEHHMANKKPDETAPVSAWHATKTLVTITRCNAGDWESIERTAEQCLLVMEAHALDASVHGAPSWGAQYHTGMWSDSYMARLAKAWRSAVQFKDTATAPANKSPGWFTLVTKGWK